MYLRLNELLKIEIAIRRVASKLGEYHYGSNN
jgi:hypothetical protein